MLVVGFLQFSGVCGVQAMSIILPAAGCDLGLTGFQKGILNSSAFSGMIFSSLLFGSLADRFGRRTIILYCSTANIFLSLFASLAPTYLLLNIAWFLNGFLLGGVFSPSFVYVTEFSPIKIRGMSVVLPGCIGSLGSFYLPGMAWLILPLDISIPIYGNFEFSSWRLFLALLALPSSLALFLIYKLPESPKYTLNQGDEEGTLRTLATIYSLNLRKDKSEFPISSVCLDASDRLIIPKSTEDSNVLIGMVRLMIQQYITLFTPPLLFYTALSCCMLCGVIGVYNTLFLWLPEQMRILMEQWSNDPGYSATLCQVLMGENATQAQGEDVSCTLNHDIFIISIVTALLQSSVLVVVSFVADRFGKKLFLVLFTSLSCIGCIILLYVNQFFLTVAFLSLTVIILCTIFPVGLSIIVDFFPTSLRSSATSITMLFGRVGASVGSQIYGSLYQSYCEQVYWGIISIIVCSVILFILMPTKRTT